MKSTELKGEKGTKSQMAPGLVSTLACGRERDKGIYLFDCGSYLTWHAKSAGRISVTLTHVPGPLRSSYLRRL